MEFMVADRPQVAVSWPFGLRRVTSDKDSGGKPALPSCSQRADAAELLVGGAA